MNFYRIDRRVLHDTIMDQDGTGRLLPKVSGKDIQPELLELFANNVIDREHLISKELPVIDYFICWQSSMEIEFDWILLDAYSIAYHDDYAPINIDGWLISPKFKEVLDNGDFVLGRGHTFHPAKLRYQGKYLDYFVFQYKLPPSNSYIPSKTTLDYNSDPKRKGELLTDEMEVLKYYFDIRDGKITDRVFHEHHQYFSDLLYTSCTSRFLISERLKDAIEKNGITGYEFEDYTYSKFSFEDQMEILGHDRPLNIRNEEGTNRIQTD